MPRRATGLNARKVQTAAPGRYCDGDGLYLLVRSAEAAFWVFRYTRAIEPAQPMNAVGSGAEAPQGASTGKPAKTRRKMREMGLGRARGRNAVSLAAARDAAKPLWRLVRNGVDPLDQKEAEDLASAAAAQAEKALAITFRAVTRFYLDAHEARWRNGKHRQQWQNTLTTYAMPHMGDLPVGHVGTAQVIAALEPIWQKKPETAQRVRGRIEAVLNYAKTREWRSGENPARWKGHLDHLLPARSKVSRVEHHAALPWHDIGDFMVALRDQAGIAARAMEFAILTAARTGEVLGATWSEIDMAAAVWTVPGQRMKGAREHRVPLSAPALALLNAVAELSATHPATGFVFPGQRLERPLSNMAMLVLLRRMQRADLTVHGFRSTFRDWCAEATSHGAEAAEAALAHAVADKVEAAYRRGDLFEKRRRLMEDWGAFCGRSAPAGEVVPLRRAS